MSQFLFWILLSALLGNPLLAAVVLLIVWWSLDRFTFRFLPNPFAWVRRWLRAAELRRQLANNPHDRKARYDLAELLVQRRRFSQAVELLQPNLEAGDEDVPTLYLMGVACLGAGHSQQGELLLQEAQAADATFRLGAIELERGRWRLARGDAPGAREALERFLQLRRGTVEGRVLLARALEKGGQSVEAALMRQQAWSEYASSPRFLRRVERRWAWRAQPWRPAAYALVAVIAGAFLSATLGPVLAQSARQAAGQGRPAEGVPGYPDEAFGEEAP